MDASRKPPVYLDYNATAPLLPVAREAMLDALDRWPGNPSSPHHFGQAARAALEECRARIAGRLGLSRREVLFTSGGSEANNTILRGIVSHGAAPAGGGHIITSPVEHPSILRTCEWLAAQGTRVDMLPVSADGVVDVDALPGLLRPDTRLVSVMAANNETGVLQPVAELTHLLRQHEQGRRIAMHTDAVQAFGRLPLPLAEWDVDAATLTAHKLGGPKGIGALVRREHLPLEGLIHGGRQERGLRAGTESLFLAAGFAAAVDWVYEGLTERGLRLQSLRDRLAAQLAGVPGFFLNGGESPRLPNTFNGGFEGVSAESLVIAMDLQGIALSTGSACSSGALEPSHVLMAMGTPAGRLDGSVRISLGWDTTEAEIDRCGEVLLNEVKRLRALAKREAS